MRATVYKYETRQEFQARMTISSSSSKDSEMMAYMSIDDGESGSSYQVRDIFDKVTIPSMNRNAGCRIASVWQAGNHNRFYHIYLSSPFLSTTLNCTVSLYKLTDGTPIASIQYSIMCCYKQDILFIHSIKPVMDHKFIDFCKCSTMHTLFFFLIIMLLISIFSHILYTTTIVKITII